MNILFGMYIVCSSNIYILFFYIYIITDNFYAVVEQMCCDECPMGPVNCIFHLMNDDEDYCFSPRMRFDPHAKCIQIMNERYLEEEEYKEETYEEYDEYIYEIRDKYMPAFTIEQTKTYLRWHAPSEYICCNGCRDDCRYDEDRCECCMGNCRCCAGCCFHNA